MIFIHGDAQIITYTHFFILSNGGGSARCISAPDVCLEQLMKERVYSNHLNSWKIYVFGISDKKRPKISCNPFIYYSFG